MNVSFLVQTGWSSWSFTGIDFQVECCVEMYAQKHVVTNSYSEETEETVESGQISINSIDQVEASTDKQVDRR